MVGRRAKMSQLWAQVQEAGKYNEHNDHTEPWGFTWGAANMDDLRKALAEVMKPEYIDIWLVNPSPLFPDTPQKIIDEGNWEAVWLAIYEIGEVVFA
jgi:hypothetical protein